RAGAAVAAVFAMSVMSGSAFGQTAPDISGTYWATQYNAKVQLVGGGELPLTPKGKAAYEKNMAGLKDGSISDDARKYCVPDGPAAHRRAGHGRALSQDQSDAARSRRDRQGSRLFLARMAGTLRLRAAQ